MIQVYIWGAGHYLQQVLEEIDNTKVKILGILDSDEKKQGIELFPSILIISPLEILEKDFDYLIITIKDFNCIENECNKMGIVSEKVISYWKEKQNNNIFVERAIRIEELTRRNRRLEFLLDSAPYEWGVKPSPQILEGVMLLKKIIQDHSSLCRFGDGEFEMIRKNERPWFQKPDSVLSRRLKEVLCSEDNMINIAIAQNFIKLERYKDNAAECIREYMYGGTREYILGILNRDRIYYDAYVTRPYILYQDRKNADKIFPLFKEVWKKRDIVIIEGEYSRIGVGNDLMKDADSVCRILCPSKNAWDKYEEILRIVLKKVSKESLICISLGPCATVLAYDLAKEGYQALDIGQLDNEYEWYLQGAKERVKISGKLVAEFSGKQELEMAGEIDYKNQVITKIV